MCGRVWAAAVVGGEKWCGECSRFYGLSLSGLSFCTV